MKMEIFAPSVAAMLLAAAPAGAQSLSDAINAALAPNTAGDNCAALGGSTPRFTDIYQFEAPPLNIPDSVDVTNGETGTTVTLAAPVIAPDGTGRDFVVRRSDVVTLDPAVANAMSEEELFAFLHQTGVQRVVISRFASGNFGAGLGGLCQRIVEARVNQNGNTGASGGFAGGSSSASGRSVSSLSSAREQSSKQKKRKKKKSGRDSSNEDGYVRLASADGGVGLVADAAGVGPFGVQTFIDLRGGYTDIDRDSTALESGFDGRSIWGQGGVTAQMSENFAIAGAFAYSDAKGDFDASAASGGANGFEEKTYTGSLFLLASLPFGPGLSLDLSAGGFFGAGDGEIER
ncbi:MAG: autotransporter domain-containing protein, partial [Parvularculaceae bacterium]|nr:autotransporter domain-containing protein [Parvularculaceae bacterium]